MPVKTVDTHEILKGMSKERKEGRNKERRKTRTEKREETRKRILKRERQQ